MFMLLFLAFLTSTSASEPDGCAKKIGFSLFQSEDPVNGTCEETGLGWTGRSTSFFDKKDQFFTKWTDFFLKPECVDEIFVHISDKDGRHEQLIEIQKSLLGSI